MAQATMPAFEGTAKEKALAQQIFELMTRAYGPMYARDALIRQSVANLASFLAGQIGEPEETLRQRIDTVVKKNAAVFAREERDGEIIVATTRAGTPAVRPADTIHTFRDRLYEPENPLPTDDLENIVTTVRPSLPAPEPVMISAYWRGLISQPEPVEIPTVPAEPEAAPEPVEVEPARAAPQPQPELGSTTEIVLSDGTIVDLARPLDELLAEHGEMLQAEVRAALEDDPLRRLVSFGDLYYPGELLINYGKNDMRRIRDFILEQGEPLTDTTILTDLYRRRPTDADFEIGRFSLNYRLARERDFEFVGMAGANLWSAKGLPAIGGKRVKASDLGQLFAYLQEGHEETGEETAEGITLHTLTFFEWEYGVLPLDASLRAILPYPLLEDQRSSVIVARYDAPNGDYFTYLCEVRYPTGARGGWLWGLEEFFHEYLVPGVVIGLAPTDEPNVFSITYDEAPAAEAKLLHLDEKRNRFVFMPVTYYAAVDENLLPSQARYNKLRNLKSLPMSERKKADVVLTHVFETVGEQLGSKDEPLYWITFDELHLAVNVLRPVSRSYLDHLLSSDDIFYADETTVGAWYYKPAPEAVAEAEEEAEEESIFAFDEEDE